MDPDVSLVSAPVWAQSACVDIWHLQSHLLQTLTCHVMAQCPHHLLCWACASPSARVNNRIVTVSVAAQEEVFPRFNGCMAQYADTLRALSSSVCLE